MVLRRTKRRKANVFARNGAQQTSGDHGEINFVQPGSTGTVRDNIFFSVQDPAADPAAARAFVYQERVPGTLDGGWELANNTIMGARADVVTVLVCVSRAWADVRSGWKGERLRARLPGPGCSS